MQGQLSTDPNYLIDTSVISELARVRPNPNVIAWFSETPDVSIYLSVLTVGEIREGMEILGDSRRREKLAAWLDEELYPWFEERLLPISYSVARTWGSLLAQAGRPVPAVYSLLAATALQHRLTMVTRTESDYDFPGLEIVNPWL